MLAVAIDNCVISQYVAESLSDSQLIADRCAFEEMLSLAKEGIIELGGPCSTLMIENYMKGRESRQSMKEKIAGIIRNWPVIDNDPKTTEKLANCLHNIIQDKDGVDSRQVAIIGKLTQARHFVTMDYRLHRQYNNRLEDIKNRCGINVFVMTPSEFMTAYKNAKI
jgi:hypothetical protein